MGRRLFGGCYNGVAIMEAIFVAIREAIMAVS
jgi:hypothetical protein